MEVAPHITVDSAIHHGKPVITGTRVPVSVAIGSLAGGMSKEEVMQEYNLTKEQIEAALAFVANLTAHIQQINELDGVPRVVEEAFKRIKAEAVLDQKRELEPTEVNDKLEFDPITPLIGTLHLGTTDLGENHDSYIAETL